MNFEEIKNNKLAWLIGAMLVFNLVAFFISSVLVEKTADRVIQKIQKEYSPAKPPYGPGINPDKVSEKIFKG